MASLSRIPAWRSAAPLLFALLVITPGCGPALEVANSPEHYDIGMLDEVGQLYVSTTNAKKQPPSSLKDFARNRDLFLGGYEAVQKGEIIVFWGVKPTPGDASEGAEEILAYKSDVPEKGGPVLLKDLTVKKVTAEEFQAAPKPAGSSSASASSKKPA